MSLNTPTEEVVDSSVTSLDGKLRLELVTKQPDGEQQSDVLLLSLEAAAKLRSILSAYL